MYWCGLCFIISEIWIGDLIILRLSHTDILDVLFSCSFRKTLSEVDYYLVKV
jgi:hypothetical protein